MFVKYREKKIKTKNSKLQINIKGISDMSEIGGLNELNYLQELNLARNEIKEIKGLENLENLRILNLSFNRISEIKGLENLVNLEELYLNNNQIDELKGLENLTKLKILKITQNPVYKWMKETLTTVDIPSVAVGYCAKITGKLTYNKTEMDEFFEMKIQQVNPSNVNEVLKAVYSKTVIFDKKLFFDFLGRLLMEKPLILDGKYAMSKYENFLKTVEIPIERLLELEANLIKKYYLTDNEELLFSFKGAVLFKYIVFANRIFITNRRIFILGIPDALIKGSMNMGTSLAEIVFIEIFDYVRGKKKKNKLETLEKMGAFRGKIGYEFPIVNSFLVDVNDKSIIIGWVVDVKKNKVLYLVIHRSYKRLKDLYEPKSIDNRDTFKEVIPEIKKFLKSIEIDPTYFYLKESSKELIVSLNKKKILTFIVKNLNRGSSKRGKVKLYGPTQVNIEQRGASVGFFGGKTKKAYFAIEPQESGVFTLTSTLEIEDGESKTISFEIKAE